MRKLAGIIAIIALLVIVCTCSVACLNSVSTNSADYRSRLEGKGYTVTNIDVSLVQKDMEWGLYATHDGDSVTVALFKNEDDAKEAEQESKESNFNTYRSGKLVMAGTEQGVKDARG